MKDFETQIWIANDPASSWPLPMLALSPNDLDDVTDYAGSYHVLEMGEHYVDYIVTPRQPVLCTGFHAPA